MGIEPCVTGPVERYEVGNKKYWKKSPLPSLYTWWEFAPEDSRAENPVTTVTVFDSFSLFTAENNLARGVGLEKVTPVIFFGLRGSLLRSPWPGLCVSGTRGSSGTLGTDRRPDHPKVYLLYCWGPEGPQSQGRVSHLREASNRLHIRF